MVVRWQATHAPHPWYVPAAPTCGLLSLRDAENSRARKGMKGPCLSVLYFGDEGDWTTEFQSTVRVCAANTSD